MSESTSRKKYTIDGDSLAAKIKELVREGNIRRVIVQDQRGKTLLDIPLTAGVVGALVAPQLAALGAAAALLSQATLVVEVDGDRDQHSEQA